MPSEASNNRPPSQARAPGKMEEHDIAAQQEAAKEYQPELQVGGLFVGIHLDLVAQTALQNLTWIIPFPPPIFSVAFRVRFIPSVT